MILKALATLFILTTLLFAGADYAEYKRDGTKRDTVILIDLGNLHNTLYGKIIQNLQFIPNEYVRLFYYDPASQEVSEFYAFYYPSFSQEERDEMQRSAGLLSRALSSPIGRMQDHQQFLKSNLTSRLAGLREKIQSEVSHTTGVALASIAADINDYTRLILFTSDNFKDAETVDLKNATVFVYSHESPIKREIDSLRDYFYRCNANLVAHSNRLIADKSSDLVPLNFFETDLLVRSGNTKLRSKLSLLLSHNHIENGWLDIHGVIKIPLQGEVVIDSGRITQINAMVPDNFSNSANSVVRGDRLQLTLKGNKYNGRYYNHAFRFGGNSLSYYEYEVFQ